MYHLYISILLSLLFSSCCFGQTSDNKSSRFLATYFPKDAFIETTKFTHGWSSADVFLVTVNDKKYVLRCEKKIDPICAYMLQQASDRNIGPRIHFLDQEQGIVLMEYLNDGQTITKAQFADQSAIANLGRSLQMVHKIPKCSIASKDAFQKIQSCYADVKDIPSNDDLVETAMEKAKALQRQHASYTFPHVMLHGDLHEKNLFYTEERSFLFIDWENARYDDPFFDLAYASCTLSFKNEAEDIFLKSYIGREASNDEKARYLLCKQVTLLFIGLDLLRSAYKENGRKPFLDVKDPGHGYGWYLQLFSENNQPVSTTHRYLFARSLLRMAE